MKDIILIVDDKIKLCKILAKDLQYFGYETLYATTGEQAIDFVVKNEIGVVVLDLKLGNENGLDVLTQMISIKADLPVMMVTGYGTIESAVEAIKIGAFDYIQKPVNLTKLQKTIENALAISQLRKENQNLKDKFVNPSKLIISHNANMKRMLAMVSKLANTDFPIVIQGESGTGKELLADFVHQGSKKSQNNIIKVNSAAFPETLLDNELFGHDKDAYTGANSTFKGVFERAHGGTLFLDEIGDMPMSLQAKILRTLQNKEVRRLGSKTSISIDVRFIAATNRNLQELVREKKFREDLYYRLNTGLITLPPLRERTDDILLLSTHFLENYNEKTNNRQKALSEQVQDFFSNYKWPGNIRELSNVINYAATISQKPIIEIEDLPPFIFATNGKNETISSRDKFEKEMILDALKKTNFNKSKTAEILKFSRQTLYNRIEKYGIKI
jgi:DNA-binding NtrC family response regulator